MILFKLASNTMVISKRRISIKCNHPILINRCEERSSNQVKVNESFVVKSVDFMKDPILYSVYGRPKELSVTKWHRYKSRVFR